MVTPASAPACPRSLALASRTSEALTVKWKRPAEHGEPVRGYTVEWGPSDKELTSSSAGQRRRITLTSLRPDTGYLIRVQAENAIGKGVFTPFLKVSTRPLPPAPPKLECLNVSHNQLKLRWGDSKIQLGTTYILETENSRRVWQQLYSGNNHSHKVSKLSENTEYRYRVCAISEAGQGPFSSVFTFKTSFAPPPPLKGAPRVPSINDSECLVQWSGLKSAEVIEYRVQLTRVKDGHVSTKEAGSDLELRITGLEPRSDYTVRVAGVRRMEDGQSLSGTWSPAAQVTTASRQGAPGAGASAVSSHRAVWAVIIHLTFLSLGLILIN